MPPSRLLASLKARAPSWKARADLAASYAARFIGPGIFSAESTLVLLIFFGAQERPKAWLRQAASAIDAFFAGGAPAHFHFRPSTAVLALAIALAYAAARWAEWAVKKRMVARLAKAAQAHREAQAMLPVHLERARLAEATEGSAAPSKPARRL